MATTLKLCAIDSCLVIENIDKEHGWYECKLLLGESSIRLGAETLDYIKGHLLTGLTEEPKKSDGQWDGREVYWVLSLAERHYVLYATKDSTDIILLWQDAMDVRIALVPMRLSRDQCLEWCRQLEMWNEKS